MKNTSRDWNSLESGNLIDRRDSHIIVSFRLSRRLKDCSPATDESYGYWVRRLAEFVYSKNATLLTMDRALFNSYVMSLIDSTSKSGTKLSTNTVNAGIKVAKVFYRWLTEEEMIDKDPTTRTKFLRPRGPERSIVSIDDVQRLVDSFDPISFYGSRNRAILLLAYDAWLRLGELCRLTLNDVRVADRTLTVQWQTKGRKNRVCHFGATTALALNHYLVKHRFDIEGGSDRLFCSNWGEPLQEQTIRNNLKRAAAKLGIKLSPHILRHSGATTAVTSGMPVALVSAELGHTDIKTTQTYLHISGEMTKSAHDTHSPTEGIRLRRTKVRESS